MTKSIDMGLAGDRSALEESHPSDRHRDYLVEHGKRDCVALSSGDVGLTINTTPSNILGGFYSYRPP